MSIAYGLFMGNIVLLPLWLQSFMGYTATQAGMLMAPVGIFAIILSPIIGKNIAKFDTRRLATIAFLVFALVLWMRSHFSTLSDFNTMMIPTLIQGIALAMFFIPLTSIILGGLPGEKIASASGLSSFCRVLFGSFGTSISVTVWQDRTTLHHTQLTEMINRGSTASNSALAGLNASGLSTEQAFSQINRMIDQQAATLAANDVFYASALIFVALIPLVWLSRPQRAGGGAAADAAAAAH
jgi:DHA2 family multidrug resistance protein